MVLIFGKEPIQITSALLGISSLLSARASDMGRGSNKQSESWDNPTSRPGEKHESLPITPIF